jgi:hypothetical protein
MIIFRLVLGSQTAAIDLGLVIAPALQSDYIIGFGHALVRPDVILG